MSDRILGVTLKQLRFVERFIGMSGGPAACGDGVCDKEGGETPWSCEADCGDACGNGVCQPEYGEFGSTCPEDCAR
jgi:hypothetical protein